MLVNMTTNVSINVNRNVGLNDYDGGHSYDFECGYWGQYGELAGGHPFAEFGETLKYGFLDPAMGDMSGSFSVGQATAMSRPYKHKWQFSVRSRSADAVVSGNFSAGTCRGRAAAMGDVNGKFPVGPCRSRAVALRAGFSTLASPVRNSKLQVLRVCCFMIFYIFPGI